MDRWETTKITVWDGDDVVLGWIHDGCISETDGGNAHCLAALYQGKPYHALVSGGHGYGHFPTWSDAVEFIRKVHDE